jgi:ABC-type sulfate transport system permease component
MTENYQNPLNILETKLPELILASFGLVAALAWNEYVKSFMTKYFKDSLNAKLTYAVVATFILVVAIMITSYLMNLYKKTKSKLIKITNGNVV